MRKLYVIAAIIGSITIVISANVLWKPHQSKVKKMNEKIAAMSLKSICVGRFMLDIPQHAEVTFRSASVAGWDIRTIQETEVEFIDRVKRKEGLLSAEKDSHGGNSLEAMQEVKNELVRGTLFMFGRRWIRMKRNGEDVISETVEIEALARSGSRISALKKPVFVLIEALFLIH